MAAEAQVARRWTGVEVLDLPLPVPAGHAPLSMRFCRIPAGSFRMGARGAETSQKSNEEPVHQVEVPYDFWMATYVVMQREYAAVFAALGLARGAFTAAVLATWDGMLPQTGTAPALVDRFDLIAGTSTGSILAAGMAMGLPPAQLVELYRENATTIFPAKFGFPVLFSRKYATAPLREALER